MRQISTLPDPLPPDFFIGLGHIANPRPPPPAPRTNNCCVPPQVIYDFIGIPEADFAYLSANVAVRSSGSSNAKDAAAAADDLVKYMDNLVGGGSVGGAGG